MPNMNNAKILIMATNGFEQSELQVPLKELRDAGATVHVATLDGKAIKGWDQSDWGESVDGDLKNAGANVVDKEVAISNGIITSRSPDDLPAFVAKIIEEVKEGEHSRDVAA